MLWTKLKVVFSKAATLAWKAVTLARSNPRALGPKVYRKIYAVIAARCELEVFCRHHILLGGVHYPIADLLPAKAISESSRPLRSVVIIVPVYRDIAVTKRCLDSVIAAGLPKDCRLLVVEDKSPDSGMGAVLDSYRSHANVTVLHNDENLGFVKTVNLGMKWANQDDVILLNSDTEVAGDWVERMGRHVHANQKIASVTATSNHATICSFPLMDERPAWPLKQTTAQMQSHFGAQNNLRSVEIPTAVGFCMYIARSALTDVGLFDEEAFGKGYGEECDFCMRATRRGWTHLQALDVGVFHQGEVSFAKTSNPSKERSEKIVRERYPEYAHLVAEFAGRDPARAQRIGVLLDILGSLETPTELLVTHIHGGGVERFVQDQLQDSKDQKNILVLRQGSRQGRYRLYSADPSLCIDLEFSPKYAPELLRSVCQLARVRKMQFHHLMDMDGHMLKLLKALDIPFDFYMHDYWTICPQINLTTQSGQYCGEPAAIVCNRCIAERNLRPLAPLPNDLPHQIDPWRELYAWIFERASAVVCPSRDVELRAKRYHPGGKTVVRYHEDQAVFKRVPVRTPIVSADKPLRIAVLGAMAPHKGSAVVRALADYVQSKRIPIEIFVFGTFDHQSENARGIQVLGSYDENELEELLEKKGIHLVWFPPGAPETYSYTLSHAMSFGYPIVAPRFGAFTERLEERSLTWTYDIRAEVSEICGLMIQARNHLSH